MSVKKRISDVFVSDRAGGSLKRNGRSNTALTTLKIAVFAAMPNASVISATAVKPGSWPDF